jgi:N-acetylmuramoyl-L-alanine amidase
VELLRRLGRLVWVVLFATVWLQAYTLQRAVVKGDRLLLTFSRPFPQQILRTFRLTGDDSIRYVFDFSRTRLGSPRVPLGLRHRRVRSIRISQYRPDTVRIVVEVERPYRMIHGWRGGTIYGIGLPVDAAKPSVGALFASVTSPQSGSSEPRSKKQTVRPASKHTAAVSKTPTLRHRYTIVIDPGHGGHDTGAIGGGKREKDLVLAIARRTRNYLRKMGMHVIMTRSSDRFVRLRDRTRYANRKHGDVFVSIHANSIGNPKKRYRNGVETYFLQTTRSERAKRVAARENSVVLRRKDRLSKNVILNAVMTGPKIVLSNKLAIDVQRFILGNVHRLYRDVTDGGVRPAPFWVLVGAEMPAVLVEVGYLSNARERKRLFTRRYQERIAKGIAEGIVNYLRNREREIE